MDYKYLKTLTLMIILLALVVNPVIAGIIINYDVSVYVTSSPPPIILQEPTDTRVTASLNKWNTSANVSASIPPTYTISLVSRKAIYWNTFDDYDPIAAGELIPLNTDNCTWTWDSVNGELVGEAFGLSAEYGGECILAVNRVIPPDQVIYIDVNMMWYTVNAPWTAFWAYSDIVFMNKTTGYFYTLGNNYWDDTVYIYRYDAGGWNILDYNSFTGGTFARRTWYDLLGVRNNTDGYLAEIYQDTIQVETWDTLIGNIDRVGLGMFSADGETVKYDLLLVTLGGPPYYVNITGLQAGWYVEIYDENNNLIIGPVQATGSTLSIDFWDYKILENGSIYVYDSSYNLITNNTFRWIIGGDTYWVGPSTYGAVLNILSFYNNDSISTYNVTLALLDGFNITSTTPGSVLQEVRIWTESGGQVSYPIIIQYNSTLNTYEVLSPITSAINLYPLYPGNIYLYWYGDPGITANIRLLFIYWINQTYVTYTINITVTS